MAPSIRYMNQSAPFWDWIANFEDQAAEHPWFNTNNNDNNGHGGGSRAGPWGRRGGWGGWGGPHGHPHHHHGHPPPPPPPGYEAAEASATAGGNNEDANATRDTPMTSGDENAPDPPEEAPSHPHHEGRHSGGRGGRRCGGRRGGPRGWGGPGPHHGGPGGPHRHSRGPWGPPPHMRGGGMPGGFGFLSELFAPHHAGEDEEGEENNDWKPEADVFDTKEGYIIHLSLPGAHKEDVGVSWDPEKSELSVAGVVHRPGDEEFLKSLALDERRVGVFDRKIRLGTRASPAQVDVDGITAKLENGILVVDVPKLMADFVDIKKVEIE